MSTTHDPRRAALTLHALPLADRQWVIDQLPGHQQQMLVQHLAELETLGMTVDPRLVQLALESTPPKAASRHACPLLVDCRVEDVHAAVGQEPAAVVARILECGPWSWESPLLQRLDDRRRDEVAAHRRALPASARLDRIVLDGLCRRLSDLQVIGDKLEGQPLPSDRGLGRWLSRLRRLRWLAS